MISDLDQHVGAVLQRLEKHGLSENTVVVFTSDNGPTHGARDKRFQVGGAGSVFFNSTGGLKGFKGSCDEGGIRVPCIVRWPGKIKPGTQTAAPSYFPDWFPTLASIAKVPKDADWDLDGEDLTEVLLSQATLERKRPMIWEFAGYGGIVAVRSGDWKAIRRSTKRKKPGPWELYDLAKDPQEKNDVASQHDDTLKKIVAAYLENRTPEPDFPQPLFD